MNAFALSLILGDLSRSYLIKLSELGRESEARGEWAGGAVSLAHRCTTPSGLQCECSQRRLAVAAARTPGPSNLPRRYATCNELPGYQDARRGKPLHFIHLSFVLGTIPRSVPVFHVKLFSLLAPECGKASFRVPTLSFNV